MIILLLDLLLGELLKGLSSLGVEVLVEVEEGRLFLGEDSVSCLLVELRHNWVPVAVDELSHEIVTEILSELDGLFAIVKLP